MIIGIAIPSCIAILGNVLTYKYITDVENRQGYVQIGDDLKELVLEVRRNERNFLYYKNEESLKNLHNAISNLSDSATSISPKTTKEIGKTDFLEFQNSIGKYSDLIDSLYDKYLVAREFTEKVRAEGRKLETFVSKGGHAKELTTSFILHLRLLEKNYMLFHDKKSFLELNSGLSQLTSIIPFCNECSPYIQTMKDLFKIYSQNSSMEDDIQIIGDKFEKNTKEIAIREREKISSFVKLTKRHLLIALALLCTLGPLFVYKTATYIVTPIKRLSEITKRISEGDITLRAPLKEHDETFSLAVSFNTMLDHLQLTHESLEKSLELLREKQAQLVESEKRASIGLLVSGVAHELNNPLNNISLTAETMLEDLEELDPDELKGYVQDIFSQSERAHHIVEDLLDFARARRSTVMEKQDIAGIVKGSVNLIANQLRVNNINLHLDVPEKEIFVRGNLSKLEQVFVNIFINAIQAMKDRGTLTVSIEADEENKNVHINICDTGPGISPDKLKDIFEPFFTTKPVGQGTGLGLSVSQSLIKEHGGEIEVESEEGIGTTFTVKFPLYGERGRTAASGEVPNMEQGKTG